VARAPNAGRAAADRREDRQFTTTLANGMALLSCFREGERRLAHRDFVVRTGLAKANVSRLAFTLVQLGFLRLERASGKYLLGSPVLSMGYPLLAGMHIRQIARPWMRETAEELGATVSMAVRDRAQMISVEASRGSEAGTPGTDIGAVSPLLGSATGMAWLASVSAFERERAVNQALVAAGAARDAGMAARVARGLKAFARDGYCVVLDESGASGGVAVPLRAPIDSESLVFDCILQQADRGLLDAAGRRLALMTHGIEGALSMH
jgi:DNA-binding IclR family transcriptional regulator